MRLCTEPFLCNATTLAVFQIPGIHFSDEQALSNNKQDNRINKGTVLT